MSRPPLLPPGRIPALDGLRAIAVLAVVADHLSIGTFQAHGENAVAALRAGDNAVRFFFVLSGFVITHSLLREQASTGQVSIRLFWVRRIFRILPAYLVYLAAVALLTSLHVIAGETLSLWRALFFTTNWFYLTSNWFYAHTWTLGVEQQFYLVGPLVAFALLRGNRRAVTWATVAIFLACIFYHRIELLVSSFGRPVDLDFLTQFRYICGGVLLGFYFTAWSAWLRRIPGSVIAAAAMVLLVLPEPHWNGPYWARRAWEFFDPAVITLIVGWLAGSERRCAWLDRPWIQTLGANSYSIYLWQQLFLAPAVLYFVPVSPWAAPLLVALALAAGSLSHAAIERPFIRWGKRWSATSGPA